MFEASPPRPIKTPSLERQKLALWLAFLAIIGVSAFAFYTSPQLIASAGRAERTETLLIEIADLLSNLKDVETGGRGYALSSGDARHLRRMELGIAATEASTARLRKLVTEPELRRSFDDLFQLTTKRIESSRQLVAERGDKAKTSRNLSNGLLLMDRIRTQVAVIYAVQQREYQRQRQAFRRQTWIAGITVAGGIGICLAVIAWLFSLTGKDIERRRQLEEELRALNHELDTRVHEQTVQLRDSEDRAGLIIDAALDAVVTIDQAGAISGWNPQAEAIFGWTREEVLGRPVDQVIMPERLRQAHRDGLERYLTTGAAKVLNKRIELAALHKNGGELAVELAITPIRGVASLTFSAFIRDVTEHRSREEQLRQLQRMDAIGRLTGGVAHDFNNLLAVVYGNSEILRDRIASDPDALEMLDDLMGAASRGAELVKRLLAFARMQHLEPEAVDLNARLSSIVGLLKRVIGEEVSLQVKTARGLWPAIIDPTQVDDALVNLAINARDAMPDGGALTVETGNVHFDADVAAHYGDIAPGEYVMLAVSDTGTGMSEETIRRVFEPFFTTKEEGKGTGLGLSQVFGWVKQSGGHIKIYSELGHGTTVKLYLPRAQTDTSAAAKTAEVTTPRGNEMILVVEDNPNVRKTVIRQLHDLGYQTMEAECGARALELAGRNAAFDLLLTDVIMPGGITGYQLADELREARPALKVLFTSGYTELASAGDRKPRTDGLLSKPYRKHDLGRAIRVALDLAGATVDSGGVAPS